MIRNTKNTIAATVIERLYKCSKMKSASITIVKFSGRKAAISDTTITIMILVSLSIYPSPELIINIDTSAIKNLTTGVIYVSYLEYNSSILSLNSEIASMILLIRLIKNYHKVPLRQFYSSLYASWLYCA